LLDFALNVFESVSQVRITKGGDYDARIDGVPAVMYATTEKEAFGIAKLILDAQ
jgi:hypothetical protein